MQKVNGNVHPLKIDQYGLTFINTVTLTRTTLKYTRDHHTATSDVLGATRLVILRALLACAPANRQVDTISSIINFSFYLYIFYILSPTRSGVISTPENGYWVRSATSHALQAWAARQVT